MDFSYTWDEHGGLDGHIDRDKRGQLRFERVKKDEDLLDHLMKHLDPDCPRDDHSRQWDLFRHCVDFLENPTTNHLLSTVPLNFWLMTGLWRCGATYLLNEYAKMNGYNIRNEHICFNHDFYPDSIDLRLLVYDPFLSKETWEANERTKFYFATILAFMHEHNRSDFFRRSVFGAFLISRLVSLKEYVAVTINWKHIIRDVCGVYYSADKYYGKEFITKQAGIFRPASTEPRSDFGRIVIYWFMANTSILPSLAGLPFWTVLVNMDKSVTKICKEVTKTIDEYIETNKEPYGQIKPEIIKFGSEAQQKCEIDGQFISGNGYKPDKFNFVQVKAIDDPYVELYECLLEQLTRLYQTTGLNFDGKLERV